MDTTDCLTAAGCNHNLTALENALALGTIASNNIQLIRKDKMTKLQQNIKAFIRPGEQRGYVAECLEISVVTQGETLDEVAHNLLEAVSLHLEGEDTAEFGLVGNPTLIVTFELQPEYA